MLMLLLCAETVCLCFVIGTAAAAAAASNSVLCNIARWCQVVTVYTNAYVMVPNMFYLCLQPVH